MKNVIVWKFTPALGNIVFLQPFSPSLCLITFKYAELGGSFRGSVWSRFCSPSVIVLLFVSIATDRNLKAVLFGFYSWFLLIHLLFNSCVSIAAICLRALVILLSGAEVESAHWLLPVDVVTMVKVARWATSSLPPFSRCYVTALLFIPFARYLLTYRLTKGTTLTEESFFITCFRWSCLYPLFLVFVDFTCACALTPTSVTVLLVLFHTVKFKWILTICFAS